MYPFQRAQFTRYLGRRSVVYGLNGMVACSQPLAARAGQEVLAQGGNSADAAIAVAAALNVTEPASTGIGGDMFILYYDAKAKSVQGLNGSGRSPISLTLDKAREILQILPGKPGTIPLNSVLAIHPSPFLGGYCSPVVF
ncbi:nucleophile aminohydrolase [Aspergillus filifer]